MAVSFHVQFFLQIIKMFHCFKTSVPQEEGEEQRGSNGAYLYEAPFNRPRSGWVHVPFTKVRPEVPGSSVTGVPMEAVQLSAGDRVTYVLTDECRHGMVLGVKERSGQTVVQISTVSKWNRCNAGVPLKKSTATGGTHRMDPTKAAAAVFRTLMKMGKREERLRFRWSALPRTRCRQV